MTFPQMLRQECTYNGSVFRFTKQQHEVLLVLLLRRDQIVPIPELIEILWPNPDREPEWALDMVRVHVCRIKSKVPGLIKNFAGRGYSIGLPSVKS